MNNENEGMKTRATVSSNQNLVAEAMPVQRAVG
jgi:hypothetical protein